MFDLVILTATNEAQAAGYRAALEWRCAHGMIPPKTGTIVLADPGGRRVGSFGATLNAIRESGITDWGSKRVFVCHSGGDSKRTPAYAAHGKVFTPVPARDGAGNPLSIFDLILANAARLPSAPGLLVASGDVVLTFGAEDLGRMEFAPSGVTGVGYRDSIWQGARHGVYVAGEAGEVKDFLQKPDEAAARAAGAVDAAGLEVIDTGLIFVAPDLCRSLATLAEGGIVEGLAAGEIPQMDIYEEFLMALVPSMNSERYLSRFVAKTEGNAAHRDRLAALHALLGRFPFRCLVANECDFFHIGSSAELLDGFGADSLTARRYGFASETEAGAAFVFNSRVQSIDAGGNALVEGCAWPGTMRLAGGNVVTGIQADDATVAALGALCLPKGIGLVAMPIGEDNWAAVAYGVTDDFKTAYEPGAGKPCLFLGRPVEEWLKRSGVESSMLWEGDESLGMWSARLWRTGPLATVLRDAVETFSGLSLPPQFLGARRLSISQLIPMVNHKRAGFA